MAESPPQTTANTDDGGLLSGWLIRHARWVLAGYWLLLLLGTHWPKFDKEPPEPPGPLDPVLQLDKVNHFVGFGGLMLLLVLARVGGSGLSHVKRYLLALCIALAYAAADELTQGFVPGRELDAADLLANAIGILAVYVLALLPADRSPKRPPRVVIAALVIGLPALTALVTLPGAAGWVVPVKEWVMGEPSSSPHPFDYIGHGVVSMAVSVLLIAAWPMASRRPRRAGAIALLILLLSGPATEIIQHYTGRQVEAKDALSHAIGVLLAMVWWAMRLTCSPKLREPAPADGVPGTGGTDTAAANDPDPDTSRPGFVGHALLVSVLTLVSRFAGLARDAVLAAALGMGVVNSAFIIGFLVPNLFRRLFGEGALTAAFIPHYTELLERDTQLAKRFVALTLTVLTVVLAGVVVIAELALGLVAQRLPEGHKAALAVYYTQIMLPYMPMICAVALVGGVLQVHKRFTPPAAAPLILNGVLIAAVLLATGLFAGGWDAQRVATWAAFGVLIAGLLQLAWQLAVLLRISGVARSFRGCGPTMRSMLIMMGPMVLGLAVFQINALLDALIAFFFAPANPASAEQPLTFFGLSFDAPLRIGDVTALTYSQRLYQFPLGVFGIAIATAIFPALSAAAARFATGQAGTAKPQAAPGDFTDIVRHGLRLTVFIGLPASVGLILVRVPLARAVFEHGRLTTDDALRIATILAGYAASVWAYSMTHTLTRAFYALKDATTPLKVSAGMVLLNLTLNLSLIWSLGAAGLAWSTAISAAGQVVLLLVLLRKRVASPVDRSVAASWGRSALASAAMAAVLLPIVLLAEPASLSWLASAGLLVGMVLLGAGVVFVVAKLTQAEELTWLRRRSVQ